MSEATTLSKLRIVQLLDRLMGLLNKAHGGDYYDRFKAIAKERSRKVESSHFSRMDSVSMQLLIETLETLIEKNERCVRAASEHNETFPDKEAAYEALAH